ncbi:MAG: winged helix-turn-helix domain-containing protein, partial [Limisphaerales bacterium]
SAGGRVSVYRAPADVKALCVAMGDGALTIPDAGRSQLGAVLRRLDGARKTEAAAESDSPIEIDEERIQVTYFGEPVTLSSTEFRLLRALCQHPGRVFSRSQLMNIAWNDPEASMERTVDAHVKSLRSKLKNIRDEPDPIETHRGIGYAMRENW